MNKLNLRLFRKIKNSFGQYIAVSIVIIIGIMIYIGMSMAMVNLEKSVNQYREYTNYAHIYVELQKIPASSIKFLYEIDGIESIQGRIYKDVQLITDDEKETVTARLVSTPEINEGTINQIWIHEGSYYKGVNSVLPTKAIYDARQMNIGDELNFYINGNQYKLTIDGIGASSEFIYPIENEQTIAPDASKFGVFFIPETFAMKAFGFNKSYNQLLIRIEDINKMNSVIDQLERKLKKYGVTRVYSYEDHLNNEVVDLEIENGKKSAGAMPIVFLLVAAFIIIMMINKIVKNDRMSIGVLKAIGYSNVQLLFHYAKYALGIGLIGGTIGILLGIAIADYFAQLYIEFNFDIPDFEGKIYYGTIILGVILTGIFCAVAGIVGAIKVVKIHPAESIRPDPPKIGKSIFLESTKIWKKLNFSMKLVMKNVFRNKKRLVFLSLGVAVTFSVISMPFYMNQAMNSIMFDHFEDFMIMDYNITFNKPMNEKVLLNLKEELDYNYIEGKIEYPVELKNGWKKETASLIGIKKDTKFYNFINVSGEKISLDENGIYISEGLAKKLDIKKGNEIIVKSFVGDTDKKYIKVIDIIKQQLGANVYMNIDYARNTFYESGMINGAYMDSSYVNTTKILNEMDYVSNIQSTSDMLDMFYEYLDIMFATIAIMIIFGGVLGFAIVYNSTIISIKDRQLEFSSLRVLGFTKNEIFKTIVYENVIITIFGIIIGIPLAISMIEGVGNSMSNDMMTITTKTEPIMYLYAGLLTIIFIFLALVATYRKIHRLQFIDALKNRMS